MGHKTYPYLLRELEVVRPNQVWATDITYIRMRGGFLHLTAIMDWFSRYVVSFRLSNTLDVSFCLKALEAALTQGTPEIFNSDQGPQFTSREFTERLQQADIRTSMDSTTGRRHCGCGGCAHSPLQPITTGRGKPRGINPLGIEKCTTSGLEVLDIFSRYAPGWMVAP